MQEHSDRTNQPVLPVMSSDGRYALDPPMVVLYKPGMIFESRNILPASEPASIDQQSDRSMLLDERLDLWAIWRKSSAFNFSGAMIRNVSAEIVSVLIMQTSPVVTACLRAPASLFT